MQQTSLHQLSSRHTHVVWPVQQTSLHRLSSCHTHVVWPVQQTLLHQSEYHNTAATLSECHYTATALSESITRPLHYPRVFATWARAFPFGSHRLSRSHTHLCWLASAPTRLRPPVLLALGLMLSHSPLWAPSLLVSRHSRSPLLDRSKSHAVAPLLAHFDSCFAPSCPLRLARLGGHARLCLLASLRASHRAPARTFAQSPRIPRCLARLCWLASVLTLSRSLLLARVGSHAIAGSRWASRLPALACFSRPRYHLCCLVTGSRSVSSPRWLASVCAQSTASLCALCSLCWLALEPALALFSTRTGFHAFALAFAGSLWPHVLVP